MASKPLKILYIGRDRQIAEELERILSMPEGILGAGEMDDEDPVIALKLVTSQKAALEQIRSQAPRVILIETGIRSYSRTRFCKTLRHRLPKSAILTVGNQEPKHDSFAYDGFVRVPLTPTQAGRAISQALDVYREHTLEVGELQLDMNARLVCGPAGEARLTPKQCQLLQLLMERAGEVVERQEIMLAIWDTVYLGDTRTLDVHICWLREQIEPNPSYPVYLETIRGVGYRLTDGTGSR
jgi:DNA-binding response OmpR family regulator